jgi:predicted metalloendopeptidase
MAMEHIEYFSRGGAAPSVPSVDPRYSPATDFYNYVNARWQKAVKMPAYEDDFGISEEIELDLRRVLLEAVNTHRRMHPTDGVSRLATSFLDPSVQASAVSDLRHALDGLHCVDSSDGLGRIIGTMNRVQCQAPLLFVVNSDYYDSKKCCVYIYEPSLNLPSKHDYDATSTNRVLPAYERFLHHLGGLLGVEGLETSITAEAELIPFLSEGSEMRNVSYVYNPHRLHELEKAYPSIPWRSALTAWGLDSRDQESVQYIVTNVKYTRHLNKLFHTLDAPKMTAWFKSLMINYYVKYLPPPFDDIHHAFFEKLLKGVDKKLPQTNLTLKVLMNFAQQDLSHLFVETAVPAEIKRTTIGYIRLLKEATARRLQGLRWMEPTTKRAALEKVSEMSFQVAYPEKWVSETRAVTIDSERPFQNLVALASADTDSMIRDLREGNCRKRPSKWREGAFEVNAYYYPEGNMLVVPAGILRPPFFDTARSDAWNLGAIGVAISHEITHGFDDDGRTFDGKGNYVDWWTPSDERTYRAMSRAVVKLFDGQKYMGGHVDGKMTLNENLADLGGMAIALDALRTLLPSDPAEQKKAYVDFFTGFAVSWRQKDRPKKAKQALLLDVHAPPLYRVNLIVKQFEEFYTAFDILPGTKGYVPLEERIVFW